MVLKLFEHSIQHLWVIRGVNIIDSFSLLCGLLSGLGLLSRMFCFLSFKKAVRNKLYYTGDEPHLSNICPTSVQLLLNECWSNVETV